MKRYFLSFNPFSLSYRYKKKKVARKKRVTRKKAKKVNNDYLENKEKARVLILKRLELLNKNYNFHYNRVSIRDQSTRWGSCSRLANLNFNYRLVHLPLHLCDYVIVHELCHLEELNHSQDFWNLVAREIPDYKERRKELRDFRF